MPTALPARAPASRRRTPNTRIIRMRFARLLRLAASLPLAWARWNERHRQRQALAELDDRMLDDIGVTRRQAEREYGRPPWR
jgi:uncharacterized protein YjiS (DUF1127 family)